MLLFYFNPVIRKHSFPLGILALIDLFCIKWMDSGKVQNECFVCSIVCTAIDYRPGDINAILIFRCRLLSSIRNIPSIKLYLVTYEKWAKALSEIKNGYREG